MFNVNSILFIIRASDCSEEVKEAAIKELKALYDKNDLIPSKETDCDWFSYAADIEANSIITAGGTGGPYINDESQKMHEINAAIWLCGRDLAFFTEDGNLSLLCNDTFGYACADAEEISLSDAPKIKELVQKEGWPAVVKWISEVRRQEPLKEVKEHMITMESLQKENKKLKKLLQNVKQHFNADSWDDIKKFNK